MKIKRGVYEHFLGRRYTLVGQGKNAETGESVVILMEYQKDDYEDDINWWVCPTEMFLREESFRGETVVRFKLILDYEPLYGVNIQDLKKKR